MALIADYKIIKNTETALSGEQSHEFDFDIKGQIAKDNEAQGPYLLVEDRLYGVIPATTTIELNGLEVDHRDAGESNLIVTAFGLTRIILLNSGNLHNGSNTLKFTLSSGVYEANYDISKVIVHFQRKING